jgi:hypothetical protein
MNNTSELPFNHNIVDIGNKTEYVQHVLKYLKDNKDKPKTIWTNDILPRNQSQLSSATGSSPRPEK